MTRSKCLTLDSRRSSLVGLTAAALLLAACGGKEHATGSGSAAAGAASGGAATNVSGNSTTGGSVSTGGSNAGGSVSGGSAAVGSNAGGSVSGGSGPGGSNVGGSVGTGGVQNSPAIPNLGAEYNCKGPVVGSVSGSPPVELGGNSAEFRGLSLGSGTTPNSQLRKPITAKFSPGTFPPYTLGQGYATRSYVGSTYVQWIIPITYTGVGTACFHSTKASALQNSNGVALATETVTYVEGSVGGTSGIYSSTCLQTNETGYFFGITSVVGDVFTSLAQVELQMDTPLASAKASTKVLPKNLCASASGLTMTVANHGPAWVTIGSLHYYLVSDETGPVTFGFFNRVLPLSDSSPVSVADEPVLADTLVLVDGSATRVRPFLQFDLIPTPLNVTSEFAGNGELSIDVSAAAEAEAKARSLKDSLSKQRDAWNQAQREVGKR
ncbi:MAG: hypothetical protein SFV15_12365 [Polyangiaceae bacterium]|nr:hypothetical protein [Polyangiaceae bacterium]